MLTVYELFDIINKTRENHDALYEIKEDFIKDFNRHFDAISFNKATRAAALKALENGSQGPLYKDDSAGCYATGTCLYFFSTEKVTLASKPMDMTEIIKSFLADREPVDMQIVDAIATARALGWRPNTDARFYYIEVGGVAFDFNLIYPALQMTVDGKKDRPRLEICRNACGNKPALHINGKKGSAFILPNIAPPADAVNVAFEYFIKKWDAVSSEVWADGFKTA